MKDLDTYRAFRVRVEVTRPPEYLSNGTYRYTVQGRTRWGRWATLHTNLLGAKDQDQADVRARERAEGWLDDERERAAAMRVRSVIDL